MHLLSHLLSIPSVSSDLEQLNRVTRAAADYLQQAGLVVQCLEHNGKPSLIAGSTIPADYHFDILLQGHLDVVPGDQAQFEPRALGNKLYARGASDMKGVVAGMMEVLVQLHQLGKADGVGIMLTCDEEIGGFDGVGWLVAEKGVHANVVFLPDGGDNWQICTDEKAALFIELEATGTAAHGSRPWLGINAVQKLIKTFELIQNQFANTWGVVDANNFWLPSVSLNKLTGGDAVNKVPELATAKLDIRFGAEVKKSQVLGLVQAACEQRNVQFKQLLFAEPNHTSAKNKYLARWANLCTKAGKQPSFYKACGSSDGRFFSAQGIPVVMSKPLCSEPHVADEWIDTKSLQEWQQALKIWVLDSQKHKQ